MRRALRKRRIFDFVPSYLKVAQPLKCNSQAARFMSTSYASKTKGTITLKHCAVHKQIHRTLILGGDKVGVMTIIFKQHSTNGEGIGSDLPRSRVFTPLYLKAEAVRKNSRQLQVERKPLWQRKPLWHGIRSHWSVFFA